MITIDGRHGEGGGQILRSSLSLAAISGQPVHLQHIRGGRKKPGLMRQHVTAVQAAAAVCSGHVEGAELRSKEIVFHPGPIHGGNYHFSIGSGGSACLVLQTVLPILMRAEVGSSVTIEGGTHNPLAPPFDFLAESFAPILQQMGIEVSFRLERVGFMSCGGGRIVMEVEPANDTRAIDLLERGALIKRQAMVHQSGLAFSVVEREWDTIHQKLGYRKNELKVQQYTQSSGPGNAVCIAQHYEQLCTVESGIGMIGKPAETVAREACRAIKAYEKHDAPVNEHLADQLLLPMAICSGGSFRTVPLTKHSETNIDIIRLFLGEDSITLSEADGFATVTMKAHNSN